MKMTVIATMITLLSSLNSFAQNRPCETGPGNNCASSTYLTLVECAKENFLINVLVDSKGRGLTFNHYSNLLMGSPAGRDLYLQESAKAMYEVSGRDYIIYAENLGSIRYRADLSSNLAEVKLINQKSMTLKCSTLSHLY